MKNNSFEIDENGLKMNGESVAPFYPVVLEKRQMINDEGKTIRKEYDIAVCLPGKGNLEKHTFTNLSNIIYSKYWDECCDAELSYEQKKALRIYLQYCLQEVKLKTCIVIDHLGFLNGMPEYYVYDKNTVFCSKDTENIFLIDDILPSFLPQERFSRDQCLDYIKKMAELYPGVTDILLSISLFSIIKPIFIAINHMPNFFVNLYGKPGSLKTTLAKLFLARNEKQIMSFSRNNRRDVLKLLKQYEGHSVLIDDYHPAVKQYDKDRQESILDMISRCADKESYALAIVTSEYLNGSFSLQDRMIQVGIQKDKIQKSINLEKLSALQQSSNIFDYLLYIFAHEVYKNKDEIMKFAVENFNQLYKKKSEFRIERNLIYLKVTLNIFENIFPEVKEWAMDSQFTNSFNQICNKQNKHMSIVMRLEHPDWAEELYKMLDTKELNRTYEFDEKCVMSSGLIITEKTIYITGYELEKRMSLFLECKVPVRDIVADLEHKQLLLVDSSASRTKKAWGKRFYQICRASLALYHNTNTI